MHVHILGYVYLCVIVLILYIYVEREMPIGTYWQKKRAQNFKLGLQKYDLELIKTARQEVSWYISAPIISL